MTNSVLQNPVSIETLSEILEPLIRRIIREELTQLVQNNTTVFPLDLDSPLYKDMEDILQRKGEKSLQFFSHAEVWDE